MTEARIMTRICRDALGWLAGHDDPDRGPGAAVHALSLISICALCGVAGAPRPSGAWADLPDALRMEHMDPSVLAPIRHLRRREGRERDEDRTRHAVSQRREAQVIRSLLGSGQDTRDTLRYLEDLSDHGTRPLPLSGNAGFLLQGLALRAAGDNDILFASRFARAALGCGNDDDGNDDAAFRDQIRRYLEGRRRQDGCFLAVDDLHDECRAHEQLAFAVRCAATTQAIWTLATCAAPKRARRRAGY